MAQVTLCYKFVTGLRGFHVYSSEWTPVLEQKITFTKEENNPHDRFAVAGKLTLKGKLCPVTVGHVPREISRHVWYAIKEGAEFSAVVKSTKRKVSPLKQGCLLLLLLYLTSVVICSNARVAC